MALGFYLEEDLNLGSLVDPVDTFVGDGVTSTFVCVNKSVARLHSSIQVGNLQYYQYNGGFTKDIGTNSFTLSVVPAAGVQIVAPGVSQITIPVFDQAVVDGVSNPLISEVPFYLADPTEIHLFSYTNLSQYSGIRLSIVDLVSSVGAETSWCQMACAASDGTALTYGATGTDLYTAAIQSFGTLTASTASSLAVLTCPQASSFDPGDLIKINLGSPTEETRKVVGSFAGTLILTSTLDFNHYIGEPIFACGRKIWLKVTIPEDAANNIATNYYDVGVRRQGRINSRV